MILKNALLFTSAFVFCIVSCSCASQPKEDSNDMFTGTESEIIWENEESIQLQSFPSYDVVKEQYDDKTVLVWTIEETGYERNYPFRTKEINEYLDEMGYDFVVCFYPIKALQTNQKNDFYTDYVSDMVQNGEQVDIIYSSFTYIEEAGSNAYHKYIYNGLFESLDNYFETELGKKLYEIMPQNHWEGMRVNGHIYGVDGGMHTLSDDYGYYVNAELAQKYKYDILLSIEEQLDILKQVKESENCDVFAMYPNFSTVSYFADIQEIIGSVYFDEESMTAKCVLDNKIYLNRLKLFNKLNKYELLADMGTSTSKSFFIMQSNQSGGSTIYNSDGTVDVNYLGNIISAIPVFNENTSVRSSYMATGICSSSNNKDKAFELLALTQTDPYLNNLLTYGIEGTDYGVSDGYVDNIINPVSLDRFANKMICYPRDKSSITSSQYLSIYEKSNVSSSIDFAFDGRDCINESYATSSQMMSADFIDNDDFEEAINQVYSNLNLFGLDKLLQECNRQYEEYRQS